jgi:pilus assembly protein TadC
MKLLQTPFFKEKFLFQLFLFIVVYLSTVAFLANEDVWISLIIDHGIAGSKT